MQRLIDDELDILSISMPPGTGKTTLGEFFISFVMGHYPNTPKPYVLPFWIYDENVL